MELSYSGICKVLFENGLLRNELLVKELPEIVWDTAIAGKWWRCASPDPADIFTERLGHYWVWRDESIDWSNQFRAEATRWRSMLLTQPLRQEAKSTKTPPARNSDYERIDSALVKIAEAKPRTHKEVSKLLDSRGIPPPPAAPFGAYGSWVAACKNDPKRSTAWLSKRWRRNQLPAFPRGPKSLE